MVWWGVGAGQHRGSLPQYCPLLHPFPPNRPLGQRQSAWAQPPQPRSRRSGGSAGSPALLQPSTFADFTVRPLSCSTAIPTTSSHPGPAHLPPEKNCFLNPHFSKALAVRVHPLEPVSCPSETPQLPDRWWSVVTSRTAGQCPEQPRRKGGR